MADAIANLPRLSRLMLGTVQFGMPYGVANRTGQPSYTDVLQMIEAAVGGGVNCFDTAAAYGTSEEVLGRALRELRLFDQVVVVTKVRPLAPTETANRLDAARAIETSVAESRRRLQCECLPIVLFHRESDAQYVDVLLQLRDRGWLGHVGVSCDNRPGPALEFLKQPDWSALQVPANVLDQRHVHSGLFAQAAQRRVSIFVRSVFLQGLLLMPEEDIPLSLQDVMPTRRALERIAAEGGMSLAELAVRFMLSHAGVTCLVAGVETVAQVRENVALVARGPLPLDLFQAATTAVPDLAESLLTPSLWPARAEAARRSGENSGRVENS